MIFKDRFDAGERISYELSKYKNNKSAIILAIPRGGLQVGSVLAKKLGLPLDVAFTKKIGAPGNEEYAIGAVSLGGEVIDPNATKFEGVPKDYIDRRIKEIREELKKKYKAYFGSKQPPSLKDKIVIVTDDGVATGRTMLATIQLVKKEKPKRIVLAVPVGPPEAYEMLKMHVDEIIFYSIEQDFFAIGEFYENFEQVEDAEAIKLLKEANR
jgi:predicted phosphoribosyltransferase